MSGASRRRAVVTFALPDEGRDFTRRLEGRARAAGHLAPVTGRLGDWDMTVAFTGVGSGADCRARVEAALRTGPDRLISSGFAGGLRTELRVGDLVLGENHSDPALLAAAAAVLHGVHRGALTTQPEMAETLEDKSALAASTAAAAVDMETGWIGDACARAGVPMLSLRVISDAADQPFPTPGAVLFDVARQRPRYVALPLWLLTHPGQIAPFIRFVRGLTPARRALADAIAQVLAT